MITNYRIFIENHLFILSRALHRYCDSLFHTVIIFLFSTVAKLNGFFFYSQQVRAVCDRFTAEGLPNYPRGAPFTFWEQYIWLRWQLLITVSVVLAASFLIISTILVNIWAGTIVVSIFTQK